MKTERQIHRKIVSLRAREERELKHPDFQVQFAIRTVTLASVMALQWVLEDSEKRKPKV